MSCKGQQLVTLTLGGRKFVHSFLVCPLPTEAAGVLGGDFFEKTGADINFKTGKFALCAADEESTTCKVARVERAALTVFPERKTGRSSLNKKHDELELVEKGPEDLHPESNTQEQSLWLVRAVENITVAPRCWQVATAKLEIEKGRSIPSLVCIESCHIHIHGILPARMITCVGIAMRQPSPPSPQHGGRTIVTPDCRAYVMVANFSDEPLVIPKSTVLGVAERVSETLINKINAKIDQVQTRWREI